ncbi:MAG: sulfatase-like hydrolase/transferase, partial [Anaerolineales bacterium]
MSSQLNRRDFLKLVSLLPLLQVKRPYFIGKPNRTVSDPSAPNVFILVFDTLSAFHISLHGYQRETTPNLARFAERATVYHNHYSGGNFTSPGTASILTGTYPWSNRAIHLYGTVSDNLEDKNIFNLFAPKGYYRIGYTHNLLVRTLLAQFLESLDALTETRELCLVDLQLSDRVFPKDYGVALSGEMRSLRGGGAENLPPGSVFMSWLYNLTRHSSNLKLAKELGELFPRGVPSHQNLSFTIEDAVDWMQLQASTLPQPYLAYVHLLPPHQPYRTRRDFVDKFDDGWEPS